MLQLDVIEKLLPEWLAQQRWVSKADGPPTRVNVIDSEVLTESPDATLLWTIVETDTHAVYQVPIGVRAVDDNAMLLGRAQARIAELDGKVIYDALVDPDMALAILGTVNGDTEDISSVRPMNAEQSNTSLIFDDRLILKVFRRLQEGPNPDREVTQCLSNIGFDYVPKMLSTWRRGEHDLAVCQPYLSGGTEGWALALASIRHRLASGAEAGDFGARSRELGVTTGALHVALAKVLPTSKFAPGQLADSLESEAGVLFGVQLEATKALVGQLRRLEGADCGLATRVHGDFHLGQTLHTDQGWFLFDFEGEPTRPMEERIQLVSPLKDTAGMLRSFDYAAAAGLGEESRQINETHAELAAGWGEQNRRMFLDGYFSVDGIEDVLPDREARDLLLRGFEVQKAIYELNYERAYRPDWVSIPENALKQLLG